MKKALAYRKIPGGGLSWNGRGGLWLAADHLLEVTTFLCLEKYRRFFFREARAFVLERTNARRVWGWILGGVGAVFALVSGGSWWASFAFAAESWHVVLYLPGVSFGLGALVLLALFTTNLALGPSCRCHVLTPAGWQALSAPTRLRPARRAKVQIVSAIRAAQSPPAVPFTHAA